MNNNRKQKVFSMLDSLTSTELDNYIKERNVKSKVMVAKFNELKPAKEKTHFQSLSCKLEKNMSKFIGSYYKLGEAYIIAFVLECFYDKKYKIADIKDYMKALIDNDTKLKEYVYELMKDF